MATSKRKTTKRKGTTKGKIKVIRIKGKGKRCMKEGKRGFIKCPANLKGLTVDKQAGLSNGEIKVIRIKGKGKRCMREGKRGFIKCPTKLKGLTVGNTGQAGLSGSKSKAKKGIRRIRIKGLGYRCQKPNGRFTKCPK